MKRIAVLLISASIVSSCNNPADDTKPTTNKPDKLPESSINDNISGAKRSYEIVIDAPADATEDNIATAFDQQAQKLCKGQSYSKVVAPGGAVSSLSNPSPYNAVNNEVIKPIIRGYITCE